ncbi:DUF1275 domain-containing protein [Oxalobacteraceae bacterium CAVE-383]|nr:DUF1275 domain-containing protein [Oxalobacteraceae bacterium CAVE-383]
MKPTLPILMGFNGGFVDTAGFLALHGLFTAHVTGNFVTLGAALVLGTSGIVAKLLALPVFCAVIVVTRMIGFSLPGLGLPVLRTMLTVKLLLLILGAFLAVCYGPFPEGDSLPAVVTGMVLVSAMAIQNAAQRIHLGNSPPTTIMTGTTTQIMIDIGDVLHTRATSPEARAAVHARLKKMSAAVFVFALGCAAGALVYSQLHIWSFVIPPLLAAPTLFMQEARDSA